MSRLSQQSALIPLQNHINELTNEILSLKIQAKVIMNLILKNVSKIKIIKEDMKYIHKQIKDQYTDNLTSKYLNTTKHSICHEISFSSIPEEQLDKPKDIKTIYPSINNKKNNKNSFQISFYDINEDANIYESNINKTLKWSQETNKTHSGLNNNMNNNINDDFIVHNDLQCIQKNFRNKIIPTTFKNQQTRISHEVKNNFLNKKLQRFIPIQFNNDLYRFKT